MRDLKILLVDDSRTLLWGLELLIQPGNHAVRTELFLSPTGAEIVLHAHARAR